MDKNQLNEILNQLIALGGNKDEFEMWRALYPTLDEGTKLKLDKNFTEELKKLKQS